jgi:myosin heavy subunit
MSTLSKVFVVINFIFALSLMIATLTLHSKRVNWVEEARESVYQRNQLKKQLDDTTAKLSQTEKEKSNIIKEQAAFIDVQKTKLSELTGQKEQLTTENADLRISFSKVSSQLEALQNNLQRAQDKNTALRTEIDTMRTERDTAVAAREFAETQTIEVMSELRESEAELLETSKRNRALMEQVMSKDILIEMARNAGVDFGMAANTGIASAGKPITASVLEVDEATGIVILNVGTKDEVKPGTEFVISRGEKYIGKVRVRNIFNDMSSAINLPEVQKAPIEIADTAQTM